MLRKVLPAALGADVLEAGGGSEALRRVETERRVDLMFLDLTMPEVDGYQVLKTLQEVGPRAADDRRLGRHPAARPQQRVRDLGAMAFVKKSLSQTDLASVLQGAGAAVNNTILSEDKRDALQEIVNIGMGAAGAALAEVLGAFVELAVPRIDVVDRRRVPLLLDTGAWSDGEIEAVRQPFFGGIIGESLMLFDGAEPARLADLLGHAAAPTVEEQQELLLDLANVVIGACVGGIAEPLEEVVSFAPPSRLGSRPDAGAFVVGDLGQGREALVINVDFKLEERRFRGRVLVFLSEPSLVRIDDAIHRFLDALAS